MTHPPLRSTNTVAVLGLALGSLIVLTGCPQELDQVETTPKIECGRLAASNEAGTKCQPLIAPGIKSRDVEFQSLPSLGGQTTLYGTLTTPDWGSGPALGKKAPAVLLVGSAGPASRDDLRSEDSSGLYRAPVAVGQDLAEGLSRRGYAVLRVDKRLCTPEDNPVCKTPPEIAKAASWDDLVGDVIAAGNFVGQQPEVDRTDVIVLGYDQGGSVAVSAAPRIEAISDVVLVATSYDPIDVAMVRRLTWRIENDGSLTPEDVEAKKKYLSEVESGLLAVKQGFVPEDQAILGALAGLWKGWMSATAGIGPAVQQLGVPVLYVRGADDHDAGEVDGAGFGSAIGANNVVTLPGHNHALVDPQTEGQVSDLAVTAIADWLGRPPASARPTPNVDALE